MNRRAFTVRPTVVIITIMFITTIIRIITTTNTIITTIITIITTIISVIITFIVVIIFILQATVEEKKPVEPKPQGVRQRSLLHMCRV